MKRLPLLMIPLLAILLLLSGCKTEYSYYIVGNSAQQQELHELFRLLSRNGESDQRRTILIEQIAGYLLQAGHQERIPILLTTYVERHPHDPYDAYYLMLVAQNYAANSSPELARHYYRRILSNYSDVVVRGTSVHYTALSALVSLTQDPALRIGYYQDLVDRFPDKIDLGTSYYYMGKTYEKLGEWDNAFAAYKKYLEYPDTQIPGAPDARRDIQNMVDFYDSPKDWTMESLDKLVAAIKSALWRQNARDLLKYKAKENFFAMSWEQQEYDFNSQITFNIGIFLQRSRVRFADNLDMNSNAREAYLRTWGWSHRIRTWYLYFRRVDFPADPEINGNWEWAGIFFGDAL